VEQGRVASLIVKLYTAGLTSVVWCLYIIDCAGWKIIEGVSGLFEVSMLE
jgi:hypothetical protein